MVEVFREVRRCLHESGTLWLNLGDSYNAQPGQRKATDAAGSKQQTNAGAVAIGSRNAEELKPKDLCMIPWRVALALQADGWWLRSVICWHKKSCMPESVTDRPTNSWEPIFLLAKSARYFYDAEAVKEPSCDPVGSAERYKASFGGAKNQELKDSGQVDTRPIGMRDSFDGTRNQRNVWTLGPEPYSEAHFATFPTEIPRRAILAGTSARGCCPKCYAPWVRQIEKDNPPNDGTTDSQYAEGMAANRLAMKRQAARERGDEFSNKTRTVGWNPSCECGEQPIPQTILDPFGGSGTTGQVALELARRAILCELNPEYAKLIERRTDVTPGLALH
jgi:DNA modification methylase